MNSQTALSHLRSHLANERTLLAYLRTGVAFLSLGVTLNRFSLFLIGSNVTHNGRPFLHDTKNVGIGMVILGTLLLLWSMYHFLKTAKEIDSLSFIPSKWALLIFTLIIILLGAFTTFYMFQD